MDLPEPLPPTIKLMDFFSKPPCIKESKLVIPVGILSALFGSLSLLIILLKIVGFFLTVFLITGLMDVDFILQSS